MRGISYLYTIAFCSSFSSTLIARFAMKMQWHVNRRWANERQVNAFTTEEWKKQNLNTSSRATGSGTQRSLNDRKTFLSATNFEWNWLTKYKRPAPSLNAQHRTQNETKLTRTISCSSAAAVLALMRERRWMPSEMISNRWINWWNFLFRFEME